MPSCPWSDDVKGKKKCGHKRKGGKKKGY